MPRINLLPWREEDRKRRQREFLVAMGGALVAGVVVVGLVIFAFSQMIDTQRSRNTRLTDEIAVLDKSIAEIDGLERQKERLLARMEIIEQLQRSRPEVVHLFDEMSRQLPEGVYLTGLKQTGSQVELKGVAQSSTRVSALMRNIDGSEWFTDPDVQKVETTDTGPARQAEFTLALKQIRLDDEAEDGDAGASP
ncbi:MAG TPA: PilN domain-containing protein [Woeseiaceae bacterium]|nr:PilN domain-containing protein [Woeseiaceae bacterium]